MKSSEPQGNTKSSVLYSGEELMQYFLGVLEAFRNFGIVADQLICQVVGFAKALLIDIGNVSFIWSKKDFRMIVENDLHRMIAQTEEDGMLSAHPFLEVDRRLSGGTSLVRNRGAEYILFVCLLLLFDQIVSKVFQQGHLLLKMIRIG